MPFRDIFGHRKIVGLLSRSAARGSLPPSLIFAGPAGVGKHLAAIATAQAINCLDPRSGAASNSEGGTALERDACGVCSACSRIARGVHPDVILIEPGDSGSIKVDPIRDVIDRAQYRPFEGRRRVVVIDQADALIPQAQNALLKTLEEPPSASSFILVTARPDALLPTVRSRCPILRFRPLAADDVTAALVKSGKSANEARAVAVMADGSVGRALEAGSEELAGVRDLAVRVLAQIAASDDPRRRVESAKDLLAKAEAGMTEREQLKACLHAMASLLRDVGVIAAKADRRVLANADVEQALGRLAAFGGERGVRAFAAVDQALVALERNASAKIVADWVALQL